MLTIAHVERRAVATVDVPGAYLNACMSDNKRVLLMRLNTFLTEVVVQLEYNIGAVGNLVVELDKAT